MPKLVGRYLCLLLVLALPGIPFSQDTLKSITYTRAADGLLSDTANILFSDKGGNIWASFKNHGVGFFDKKSWTYFDTSNGLRSNAIQNAFSFVDSIGFVWIKYASGD